MIFISTLVISLIIGSYHQDIVNEQHVDIYNKVKSEAEHSLQEQGFNGFLKSGMPDEVWTQTVNGRNIVMRIDNVCIHVHDHFGKISFMKAHMCEAILDILSEKTDIHVRTNQNPIVISGRKIEDGHLKIREIKTDV